MLDLTVIYYVFILSWQYRCQTSRIFTGITNHQDQGWHAGTGLVSISLLPTGTTTCSGAPWWRPKVYIHPLSCAFLTGSFHVRLPSKAWMRSRPRMCGCVTVMAMWVTCACWACNRSPLSHSTHPYLAATPESCASVLHPHSKALRGMVSKGWKVWLSFFSGFSFPLFDSPLFPPFIPNLTPVSLWPFFCFIDLPSHFSCLLILALSYLCLAFLIPLSSFSVPSLYFPPLPTPSLSFFSLHSWALPCLQCSSHHEHTWAVPSLQCLKSPWACLSIPCLQCSKSPWAN